MLTTHPLEMLLLHFDCPATEEDVLEILKEAANGLRPRSSGRLAFRRLEKRLLPDLHQQAGAREEVWEADGARIEILVRTTPADPRSGFGYELKYALTLDTGTRLVVEDRSAEPRPQQVLVRLYRVWPEQFDLVRDLFGRRLGEENDATDRPRLAAANAQTAIDAGHGAFARHLIDLALQIHRRRTGPSSEEEEWLPRLHELSEKAEPRGPEGELRD